MIAPSLRLVAAVRAGARLVVRPRSGVVHLYRGPLTPSGWWVPRTGRTVCQQRTRRLSVLEARGGDLDLGGRRVCRRCMPLLPAVLGRAEVRDIVRIDDWQTVYSGLTVADLALAGRWATSTADSSQVAMVAELIHGAKTAVPEPRRTPAQAEVARMHDQIQARRRQLVLAERTPEQVEADVRAAEARVRADAAVAAGRRKAGQMARAIDRRTNSSFAMPWERPLLDSA